MLSRDPPSRAERYREKAAACTRQAGESADLSVRAVYLDLARQWHDLAKQVQWLERQEPGESKAAPLGPLRTTTVAIAPGDTDQIQ
jgi:hypothetical protein